MPRGHAPRSGASESGVDIADSRSAIASLVDINDIKRSCAVYSAASRFAALVNFLMTRSRLSLEMWSMNSTPLRWSISCCRQVASSPLASTSCWLAVEIEVADLHLGGPLDLLVVFRDRQAALLVGGLLLGRPDDLRIDDHLRLARLVLAGEVERDHALRHADLDRREPDPGGVVHGVEHVGDERFHLALIVFTGLETSRSRVSGSMMISRNAMRRDLSGRSVRVNPARSPIEPRPDHPSLPSASQVSTSRLESVRELRWSGSQPRTDDRSLFVRINWRIAL